MSDPSPPSKRPEELVDELEGSAIDEAPQVTAEAAKLNVQYLNDLDSEREVHSYPSLMASREYTRCLLEMLPDHKKVEMTAKCIDQELELQESIRLESYAGSEFTAKMRKMLTWFYAVASSFFLLLIFLLPIVFKVKTDDPLFTTMADLVKISFFAGLATIVTFFFTRRSKTRRSYKSNGE